MGWDMGSWTDFEGLAATLDANVKGAVGVEFFIEIPTLAMRRKLRYGPLFKRGPMGGSPLGSVS